MQAPPSAASPGIRAGWNSHAVLASGAHRRAAARDVADARVGHHFAVDRARGRTATARVLAIQRPQPSAAKAESVAGGRLVVCHRDSESSASETPQTLALYLAARADQGRNVAMLALAITAISQAHQVAGQPSPRSERLVRETWKGICRRVASAPPRLTPARAPPEADARVDDTE
jgi:hypothetical protein